MLSESVESPADAPAAARPHTTGPSIGRRGFVVLLAVIAVVGFGIRLAFVLAEGQEAKPFSAGWWEDHQGDAWWYREVARQIADGDGFVRPFELALDPPRHVATAEHPPLFPIVLAAPVALGLRSDQDLQIVASLIGVAGVVLIGLLGRRVAGDRVGLVAAGIAACYPMLFQPAGFGFSESLYVAFAAAVLLVAYQVFDKPTIPRWILLGVLIGLAALTRGEGGTLLLVVAWPLAWWCAPDWRGRLVAAGTVTLAALVVIAPWMVRNLTEFDKFVPVSTNGATAIAGANCDSAYSGKWIGAWTFDCIQEAYGSFDDGSDTARNYDEAVHVAPAQEYGLDYMADHASELPKLMVVRVLRSLDLWDPFGSQIDYDDGDSGVRPWQEIGYLMFWVMIPFGIYGVVLLRRRRRPSWPLIAPIAVVVVASAALHGATRFRAGAEPGIIVLASVGIVAVATSLVRRRDERATEGVARSGASSA